jgi:hypothetical protein
MQITLLLQDGIAAHLLKWSLRYITKYDARQIRLSGGLTGAYSLSSHGEGVNIFPIFRQKTRRNCKTIVNLPSIPISLSFPSSSKKAE